MGPRAAWVFLLISGLCWAQEPGFFLEQIFSKYGHQGVISFEGFEHLLESLGLGRLVFDKRHALALHKVNGSFLEVHDRLHLHQHNHTRMRRQVTTYAEQHYRCLTPQDILQTFGLEPHHSLVISPRVFLNLCPAIVFELDQRTCSDQAAALPVEPPHYSAWLWASLSVLVISLVGLLGIAMVPLVQRAFYQQLLHFLVALAVGTMCGDALLHLLPHALTTHSHDHLTPVLRATVTFLAITFFFLLETAVRHINSQPQDEVPMPAKEQRPLTSNNMQSPGHQHNVSSVAWMVIMGDGLHNLTDGLAIGAAFSGDAVAGFATAIAVLCHELPHELGDFAVLLQAGMSIRKAVAYNVASSVLSFIGMAMGVWLGEHEAASQWVYAFTAGSFLYISLVDLVPEMSSSSRLADLALQLSGIVTGASIMLVIALYEDDLSSLFS